MKVYMFPGQGSQVKGMGVGLFSLFPELVASADNILGYSIQTLCEEDPQKVLNLTQFTQPALYVVNAFMYLKKLQEEPALPQYVVGHSLGEYNALFAAGVIDFESGLRLVKRRGELMGQALDGAMAAVLNCESSRIVSILRDNQLNSIDVANYNSPKQTVLSGPTDAIRDAAAYFENDGALYIPLKVSAAFHSRYMQPAGEHFAEMLNQTQFSKPKIPVIANVNARPYLADEMQANLKKQISHSVQWVDSIRYLMGQGVSQFEEIGPGNVLAKLVTNIQKYATPLVIQPEPQQQRTQKMFSSERLGSDEFRKAYQIRYAYLTGAMVKGIASKALVVRMGKAGLMGYYGTGGLKLSVIEQDIQYIQKMLCNG